MAHSKYILVVGVFLSFGLCQAARIEITIENPRNNELKIYDYGQAGWSLRGWDPGPTVTVPAKGSKAFYFDQETGSVIAGDKVFARPKIYYVSQMRTQIDAYLGEAVTKYCLTQGGGDSSCRLKLTYGTEAVAEGEKYFIDTAIDNTLDMLREVAEDNDPIYPFIIKLPNKSFMIEDPKDFEDVGGAAGMPLKSIHLKVADFIREVRGLSFFPAKLDNAIAVLNLPPKTKEIGEGYERTVWPEWPEGGPWYKPDVTYNFIAFAKDALEGFGLEGNIRSFLRRTKSIYEAFISESDRERVMGNIKVLAPRGADMLNKIDSYLMDHGAQSKSLLKARDLLRAADMPEAEGINIVVIGDQGKWLTDNAGAILDYDKTNNEIPETSEIYSGTRMVGEAIRDSCEKATCHFGIGVGDNVYEVSPKLVAGQEDKVYKILSRHFIDFLEPLFDFNQIPFLMCLGNHDIGKTSSFKAEPDMRDQGLRIKAQVGFSSHELNPESNIERMNLWNMPESYYAKILELGDQRTAVFVLDTNHFPDALVVREGQYALEPGLQETWLKGQLASPEFASADWKIVVGHHPVISAGKHGYAAGAMSGTVERMKGVAVRLTGDVDVEVKFMKELRKKLLALMCEHRVDLYAVGHDHIMSLHDVGCEEDHGIAHTVHQVLSGAASKSEGFLLSRDHITTMEGGKGLRWINGTKVEGGAIAIGQSSPRDMYGFFTINLQKANDVKMLQISAHEADDEGNADKLVDYAYTLERHR